jgi:hypothetical protein
MLGDLPSSSSSLEPSLFGGDIAGAWGDIAAAGAWGDLAGARGYLAAGAWGDIPRAWRGGSSEGLGRHIS